MQNNINSISLLKHRIRKIICLRRNNINYEKKVYFAKLITRRIINWSPLYFADKIALFMSFNGEIDTKPIIDELWNIKKKIYLPVIHPFNKGELIFIRYHSYTKLILNKFKILEPELKLNDVLPLNQLDLIIVPLVAFDKHGQRLGMGGGFYDRILKYCKLYNIKCIGYAYDCQLVDYLPKENWDITLSNVVTPFKFFEW